MAINNIYSDGIQQGWKIIDASALNIPTTYEADVVIVGTGAGGGTAAEILSKRGINVIMLEEGPLRTSSDFNMDELTAYGSLYQEASARATKDNAISILQGRSVGGSTTINWTSSFRTPAETLDHWTDNFQLKGFSVEEMAPWFSEREQRLNIEKWQVTPNQNNDILQQGCEKLGYDWRVIPRNVKGCWNLGYCGMGCPTNAKQSMLVTTIPAALANGATLIHHARVDTLNFDEKNVSHLVCSPMNQADSPTTARLTIKANHFILAGGAINNPGILLRSKTPDPDQQIGKRTFLHPVNLAFAMMPEKVEGYYGAPQSIYSDEFQWKQGVNGPAGYKLEVPPLHPALSAASLGYHGKTLTENMKKFPYIHAMIGLLRDGFHEQSQGGAVELRNDGSPVLDYPMTDYLWDGVRRSFLSMVEIQFAAGAKLVSIGHHDAKFYKSWQEAKTDIQKLDMKKHRVKLFTAHQMGGCAMGEDPSMSVVDSFGKFHHLDNLFIFDGSTFPTSIGANPQLSIYGMVAKQASRLADQIKPNA